MASVRSFISVALAILVVVAASVAGLPAARQSASGSKPPAKSAAKKKSSAKSATRARSKKKKAAARPQLKPTPERYKQIEQALAARGYLREEPSGKWTPGAAEALRNFQSDNKLPPTGRLDARSLAGLGLATSHERLPKADR